MKTWRARAGALACAAAVFTSGCSASSSSEAPGRGSASSAAGYRTVAIDQGALQVSIEATGTLQPATQVEIGSRVSGQLLRVRADFNDVVKAGQLLAEIDATPFVARRDEAKANVASSHAEIARAQADLALREQTVARARELRARDLNSVAELQAAEGALASAQAAVLVAQAGLQRSTAALASAESDVAATRIVSPIDGIVLSRSVEAGQTVAASLQAPRLFVVARALDALELIARVDESDLAVVQVGASGAVSVDAFPGRAFAATVSQIRIDPTTESGVVTFPVVLRVDNKDRALLPGMTATVTIQGPPIANALIVPAAALRFMPSSSRQKANGSQLWVLDGATPVDKGVAAGGMAGTPRVVDIRVTARAGARVAVEALAAPAPSTASSSSSTSSPSTSSSQTTLQPGTLVIVEELGKQRNGGRGPPRMF